MRQTNGCLLLKTELVLRAELSSGHGCVIRRGHSISLVILRI